MTASTVIRALVLAFVAALPLTSRAALTTYDLILTITGIEVFRPCRVPSGPYEFGCLSLGQSFRGSFAVDSSILAVDGLNETASIYDFSLPFGALTYSTGADNTALRGFRNSMGRGAIAPGFIIKDGQVADLYGGLVGASDVPFVDFGGPFIGANRFSALDDGFQRVNGTFAVMQSPAPEPQTYAMFAGGMLLVLVAKRLRRRHSTKPI